MLPILRFYCLFLLGAQVGFSLFMLFARQAGFSTMQLAMYGIFLYVTPILTLPLVRRLPTRRSFVAAIVMLLLAVLCITQMHRGVLWYWVVAPLGGSTMILFWVVYMTRHVTAGPERANAYNSSVIVFVMFASGCVAPVIAGQIGQRFGSVGVVAASAALLCLAATQISSIKPRAIRVRLREAWIGAPRYARALLLLQGMHEALQFLFLPICTTVYFTEPQTFGAFFGVVALAGSAVNLTVSRWSDRVGDRSRMIYFGCGLMAIGALTLGRAETVRLWSIGALLMQTGFTLTLPYFMAVTLDAIDDTDDAFVVREWGCNAGRLLTVFVALALLAWTGNLQHAFTWGVLPLAAYPAVLYIARRRGSIVLPKAAEPVLVATAADVQAEGTATS